MEVYLEHILVPVLSPELGWLHENVLRSLISLAIPDDRSII